MIMFKVCRFVFYKICFAKQVKPEIIARVFYFAFLYVYSFVWVSLKGDKNIAFSYLSIPGVQKSGDV